MVFFQGALFHEFEDDDEQYPEPADIGEDEEEEEDVVMGGTVPDRATVRLSDMHPSPTL